MVGESESSSLGINESYIQSDIADIISKMYSPHFDMQDYVLSDGSYSVVGERISSNREIQWKENERTNKRFGYYYETETRNHIRATNMLDSSSSGSVSLPSVKHKPVRPGRYACRCCRTKISTRLHNKRVTSACGHCRVCTKAPLSLENIRQNGPLKDCQDFSRENVLAIDHKFEQIHSDKQVLEVVNEKHVDEKDIVHNSKVALDHHYDHEKSLSKEPEVNKNSNRTLLRRVFSRLIGMSFFDKSSSQPGTIDNRNEIDIKSWTNTKEVNVNYHQLELGLGEQPVKIPDQKQQPVNLLVTEKQFKIGECRSLAENVDGMNSILRDDYKLSLQLDLVPSGEDKSKLPIANCEQWDNLLQNSSDDAKAPLAKSKPCMSSSGELYLGKEPVRSKEATKAQIKTEVKIPEWTAQPGSADTYRLDLGDRKLEPITATDLRADFGEEWATQFWQRVFGHGHFALVFLTAFVLQLFRFFLEDAVRPLVWGSLHLACDHCLKPFLALMFDGLLQPALRLLLNVACSTRDVARPLAEAVGFFVGELARLFAACRLVEVHAPDRKVP